MVKKTKNDLSFQTATVDYQSLVMTSKIALRYCIEDMRKSLDNLHTVQTYFTVSRVLAIAQELGIVGETCATLVDGLQRPNLEVTNKPIVSG